MFPTLWLDRSLINCIKQEPIVGDIKSRLKISCAISLRCTRIYNLHTFPSTEYDLADRRSLRKILRSNENVMEVIRKLN